MGSVLQFLVVLGDLSRGFPGESLRLLNVIMASANSEKANPLSPILWSNLDWSVVQAAQEKTTLSATVSADEALCTYIGKEFLNLTQQQGNKVISVPATFTTSNNPSLGEIAEEDVFDVLKIAASQIEGLQMILFNGLRCVGIAESGGKNLIREIDFRSKFHKC